MKVLHSYKIYRPDVDGGIPFVIATLARSSDGLENEILVARRRGLSARYQVDEVPVEAVCSFGTFLSTPLAPTFPSALLRHAKRSDVVIHHAPFPLTDLTIPWFPEKAGLIVYWHADIVGFSLLKSLLDPAIKRTLRRADLVVVADRSTMESSPSLQPFADKCRVVPYGIDVEYWEHLSSEESAAVDRLRRKYPRLVLAIGRLVPYKGFDILLQALQAVEAQAVIIGEGPLDDHLKQRAQQLGVSHKVEFAGRIGEGKIKAHVHAARLLAFPSVTAAEAFGIVQLEAMAAGLPIVNTALPTGVPCIARHDQEALTVPVGDAPELAAAISQILDQPELQARLGLAGRLRARQEYSRETFLARMQDVYSEVLRMRSHHP